MLVTLRVLAIGMEHNVDVIACEDFVLRDPRLGSGWTSARSGTSPMRIQTLLYGFWYSLEGAVGETKPQLVWQQASMAKQHMTDERLKAKGLWIVGKPHARDACRHACTAYARLRSGGTVKGAKKIVGRRPERRR